MLTFGINDFETEFLSFVQVDQIGVLVAKPLSLHILKFGPQ